RILESFAYSMETLWVDAFNPTYPWHGTYRIWNTAFAWDPVYAQLEEDTAPAYRDRPRWYVKNTSIAPTLEFVRSNFDARRPGRIYWARDFSAPDGLPYDHESFARWVSSVF